MRLLLAYFIVFLLTWTVESHEKRSPNKRPHRGRTTVEPTSPSCICTLEYNPVCGSDGKTYGNPCALMCAQKDNPGLKKAYDGECQPQCVSNPDCVCTDQFDPVCGSDGITYGNPCEFCCIKETNPDLKVVHAGEC